MVKNSLPNSGGPEVEETPQCLKKKMHLGKRKIYGANSFNK